MSRTWLILTVPALLAGSCLAGCGKMQGTALGYTENDPHAGEAGHAGGLVVSRGGAGGESGAPTNGGQAGSGAGATCQVTPSSPGAAGDSPLPPWVTDDCAWEPVAFEGIAWGDDVSHARTSSLGPSSFSWTSCGDGCDVLDTRWLGVRPRMTSLGHVDHAGLSGSLMAASWAVAPYEVRLLVDLDTGMVRNALRGISPFPKKVPGYAYGWLSDPRFVDTSVPPEEQDRVVALWLTPDGGLGHSPVFDKYSTAGHAFCDAEQGMILREGQLWPFSFGDTSPTPHDVFDVYELFTQGISIQSVAGQGDMLVVAKIVAPDLFRVQSWRPDGLGLRDEFDIPTDPTTPWTNGHPMALSPTRLVGLRVYPISMELEHVAASLSVWTSPRPGGSEPAALHEGPPLPMPDYDLTPGWLKTWGDHALLGVVDLTHGRILYWVIHLPTWTVYVLEAPEKTSFVDRAYAIDDTHVFLGVDEGGHGTEATQIKRIALAKLAQNATQVFQAH